MDNGTFDSVAGCKRSVEHWEVHSLKRLRVGDGILQTSIPGSHFQSYAASGSIGQGSTHQWTGVAASPGKAYRKTGIATGGNEFGQSSTLSASGLIRESRDTLSATEGGSVNRVTAETCLQGEIQWEDWQDDCWEEQSEGAELIDAIEEGSWMDMEDDSEQKHWKPPCPTSGRVSGRGNDEVEAAGCGDLDYRDWEDHSGGTRLPADWACQGEQSGQQAAAGQGGEGKPERHVDSLDQRERTTAEGWDDGDGDSGDGHDAESDFNLVERQPAGTLGRLHYCILDQSDVSAGQNSSNTLSEVKRSLQQSEQSQPRTKTGVSGEGSDFHAVGRYSKPDAGPGARPISCSQLAAPVSPRLENRSLAVGKVEPAADFRLVKAVCTIAGAASGAAVTAGVAVETAVSKKLVQGTLTAFLGGKPKGKPKLPGELARKVQTDIGSYFGLAPLNPVKQGLGELRAGAGTEAELIYGGASGRLGKAQSVADSRVQGGQGRGRGWGKRGVLRDGLSTEHALQSATGSGKQPRPPRPCPFYKKIPGTPFTVDAFKYGAVPECSAYFLTHFHSDHYGGLTKWWCHGPIYCTPVTARLVSLCLGVDPRWLCPIAIGNTVVVDGVEVTPVPANHCPGAALLLFRLPCGRRVLHTGDFRASRAMQDYPHLKGGPISTVYLDTTYCNPKYCFPPQEDVIRFVVATARAQLARNPRTLLAVGSYSVGKERVFLALAQALGVKIFVERRRQRMLEALDWPELASRLTTDGASTPLHVLPLGTLHPQRVRAHLQLFHPQRNALLGFRPTGWTYSEKVGSDLRQMKPQKSGAVTIYGVPYSEHSSFVELREFIQFLRPGKIIPTVNIGSATQRKEMESHFCHWLRPR